MCYSLIFSHKKKKKIITLSLSLIFFFFFFGWILIFVSLLYVDEFICSLELYFELMQFNFFVLKLLSFFVFVFLIVKCYPIAYKDCV